MPLPINDALCESIRAQAKARSIARGYAIAVQSDDTEEWTCFYFTNHRSYTGAIAGAERRGLRWKPIVTHDE